MINITINALVREMANKAIKHVDIAMKPIIEHEGEEDLHLYISHVKLSLERLSDADCMCRVAPEADKFQCSGIVADARDRIVNKLAEIGVF